MDITTAFKQYLTIKDYQFSVDDNYITFKHDGWNMALVSDNDPYYFRLVLPRFWPTAACPKRRRPCV